MSYHYYDNNNYNVSYPPNHRSETTDFSVKNKDTYNYSSNNYAYNYNYYNYHNNYNYSSYTSTPKITESEEVKKKRKENTERGLSGLKNIGNTCYINSILQALAATPIFSVYMTTDEYKEDLTTNTFKKIMREKKLKLKREKELKLKQCANMNTQSEKDLHKFVISEYDLLKKSEEKINNVNNSELTALTEQNTEDEITVSREELEKRIEETITYQYHILIKKVYERNCTITPRTFKRILGEENEMFRGSTQNDSHEVLQTILDRIHEDTKKTENIVEIKNVYYINKMNEIKEILENQNLKLEERMRLAEVAKEYTKDNKKELMNYNAVEYWKSNITNSNSIITDLFTGLYCSVIECQECKIISTAFETFTTLSIEIKQSGKTTIEECLKEFTAEEELKGNNMYDCKKCNKKVEAKKKMEIWHLPVILIIHLKRFKVNERGTATKTSSVIEFGTENFDLKEFKNEYSDQTETVYDLFAISDHKGRYEFGHYISYCKNPINNKWYLFDDDDIFYIPNEELAKEIVTENAYILFYSRKNI